MESYCKVCSAQLISESQRVAHYEVRTRTMALYGLQREQEPWPARSTERYLRGSEAVNFCHLPLWRGAVAA